jgi:putative protease
LKAAVYSGTDAVYLGGHKFSARRNAVNFDLEGLKDAVRFCHGFGVKVYVAVNTLTHDREMSEMCKYLTELAEAAPDALILQDLGVASLCKRIIPEMPLHASTQMSIHSVEGVKFCAEAGFTRVIIARECNRVQLKEIVKASPIEIETFVHGALCVSVSGQCQLSAVIGGRSGNRGLCAQPCRLNYSGGKNSYALSLKDLSLINDIPELERIGVASVKIEGRLKRPEYVAAAVSACRAALNGGEVDYEGLRAVFSRDGFTRGYFTGEHGDMRGVRDAEDAKLTAEVLPQYAGLMRTPSRRVPVTMTFTAETGKPIELKMSDGTDEATAYGGAPASADKREASRDDVYAQLNRLGDTPFVLTGAEIKLSPGLFLPASVLNALRREVSDALLEKRIAMRTRRYRVGETVGCKTPEQARDNANVNVKDAPELVAATTPYLRVHCQSLEQLQAVLPYVNHVVIPAQLAQATASIVNDSLISDKIIVSPNRFINDEASLLAELIFLRGVGFTRMLCHNPAHIRLGKRAGFRYLHGAMGLNAFNKEAVHFLHEQGLTDVTASMELTLNEARKLTVMINGAVTQSNANGVPSSAGIPIGLPAYGKLPLMLLRRCPFNRQCKPHCPGYLTDRTNRAFPILCHGDYHELLNADTLWLADKLNELNGFAFLSLFLYKESPQETQAIIKAYMQNGTNQLPNISNGCEPPRNFTRALLYRGVE